MIQMRGFYKSACFIFTFSLLICCGPKQDAAEANLFSLEKVLTIDTENNETAKMGLTDIRHFDIDSEGRIFIANLKAKENYIFELNKDGSLISAFGSSGQVRDIAALGDRWLFVQTYEKPKEGSSMYDIFNATGEFIGRTELDGYQVKFKRDRLYCLKQKESGYKELVIYQMIWD